MIRLFEAPFGFAKAFNDLNSAARADTNQSITFRTDMANDEIEEQLAQDHMSAQKQALGLMNKPQILLANKGLRVNETEEGGFGEDFDPNSVLTN